MGESKIEALRMPLMGEGVHEATLVRWLKSEGDSVEAGSPLLEVATDKVDTEIPANTSGKILEICVNAESKILVNQVLAWIGPSTTTPDELQKAKKEQLSVEFPVAKPGTSLNSGAGVAAKTHASTQQSSKQNTNQYRASKEGTNVGIQGGRIRSSPLARKMAHEHGIDLHHVPGSGHEGRINRFDLEQYLESPRNFEQPSLDPGAWDALRFQSASQNVVKKDDKEFLEGVEIRREKMSRMRQLTADHMIRSVAISPHVTTVFEIDMYQVSQHIQNLKESCLKTHQIKLTYTSFLMYACVLAIKEHPIVNVSVDGYDILWKKDINLGCAVAIDSGLIVPVIKSCQDLSFIELAKKFHDLVLRARSKKLQADEVQGGTFSITNPGGFGSIVSQPIINQPQVAMLSVGAVVRKPVVMGRDEQIVVRPMCMIGLTFDHRVIDGEGGAKFLAILKKNLEEMAEPTV